MGSTPETGVWKEVKVFLKWTQGHVWKSATPLMVSNSYFKYKYVVVQDKTRIIEWEQGIDRIADCAVLPSVDQGDGEAPLYEAMSNNSKPKKAKIVEIKDIWEQMLIKFTIFSPINEFEEEQMFINTTINGGTQKL